ncbi:amino acid transporter [Oceanibaculum pacificum]|uniref:Amino acid transporter n=1 Tax=Oceanibaculum pacificum TaxID=580166 RepID=A0A154W753_9PROT|nr:amino acid transporter [Oceanibaculum pacificum]
MSLVHNERIKLSATWLNGLSIAIFAVGGFAPLLTRLYDGRTLDKSLLGISVSCFLAAFGIHLIARAVLRRLKP